VCVGGGGETAREELTRVVVWRVGDAVEDHSFYFVLVEV
jgi:hypothetical protein